MKEKSMKIFANHPIELQTSPRLKNRISLIIWLIVALLFSPVHSAQAYVDPGTGSYVIQIIIGVFFGIVYATKGFWKSIIYRIKNRKNIKK